MQNPFGPLPSSRARRSRDEPEPSVRGRPGDMRRIDRNATNDSSSAVQRQGLEDGPIDGPDTLGPILHTEMAWRSVEQVRVLLLDSGRRLIEDAVVMEGVADEVPLPLRLIVRKALNLGADGLILVHNHPSGNPQASEADLVATRELIAVCRRLDIRVHDHIVVASGGWTSLCRDGKI
jgi:DNA repair protein RadC